MQDTYKKAMYSVLPEDYNCIIEVIGVEAFSKLLKNFGGIKIRIPDKGNLMRYIKNKGKKNKHINNVDCYESKICLDDLPEQYQEVADTIGIKLYMKLVENFEKTSLYIPSEKRVMNLIRDKEILKEFDGGNYKELSRKYKLSECWVRKIVNEGNYIENIV